MRSSNQIISFVGTLLPLLCWGCSFLFFCAQAAQGVTVQDAQQFVARVDTELGALLSNDAHAAWDFATNITDQTLAASVQATLQVQSYLTEALINATQYQNLDGIDADTTRQLYLLKVGNTQPPLRDNAKNEQLATIRSTMESMYSSGKVKLNSTGQELDLEELNDIMATNRDFELLKDAWASWRQVSKPMRPLYQQFVQLSNEGAVELGFKDTGDLWTSGHDMPAEDFKSMVESTWQQVQPLYEQLHCYVRSKLNKFYGDDKVPIEGLIPAHILGNMWAQDWSNIFDLVAPFPNEPTQDATAGILRKGWSPVDMVRFTEQFFVGIGLPAFPPVFYEKSMFVKPEDREVVCHASAWDMSPLDARIKMCIKLNQEDLLVIHHECGHIEYYLSYYQQKTLYRTGANDGFHEAIGDTIALSVTPEYLYHAGLLETSSSTYESDMNHLMRMALQKIAFLPFGFLVDQWRWKVFSGNISSDAYNEGWWQLRRDLQGIDAPVPRSENDFDPGAKYHIPGNTPYMRYFLAHILQFQFQKALCDAAGFEGPLYKCSINGSTEAGSLLYDMLQMGASKPWQDALFKLSGQRSMNASALVEYFAPLMGWLEEQNHGLKCGWTSSSPDQPPQPTSFGAGELREAIMVVLVVLLLVGSAVAFLVMNVAKQRRQARQSEQLMLDNDIGNNDNNNNNL